MGAKCTGTPRVRVLLGATWQRDASSAATSFLIAALQRALRYCRLRPCFGLGEERSGTVFDGETRGIEAVAHWSIHSIDTGAPGRLERTAGYRRRHASLREVEDIRPVRSSSTF